MRIHWVKNSAGIEIPYEGEVALASTVDPIREAQKWWNYYQTQAAWCDRWIILGGGGGLHLDYLADEKFFGVVEFRWHEYSRANLANSLEKVYQWRMNITDEPHLRWGIFSFRPAWQNYQVEFEKALKILNGQAPTSRFYQQLSRELFE